MNIDTIRKRLKGKNLSDIARRAEVGLRTVRRLVNEDRGVTWATLQKVADALARKGR